jgi:glycine cleavage system transcriptional repressor
MPALVISAVGPDRPGIVGELTFHLHELGANILDSRMVNLLEAPASAVEPLRARLPEVAGRMDLAVHMAEQGAPAAPRGGLPYKLKTYSMDRPGIVHRISDLLRKHDVNIEELSTRQESGAFMGSALFVLEARVTLPPALPARRLRQELDALCEALNCDVDLDPA